MPGKLRVDDDSNVGALGESRGKVKDYNAVFFRSILRNVCLIL